MWLIIYTLQSHFFWKNDHFFIFLHHLANNFREKTHFLQLWIFADLRSNFQPSGFNLQGHHGFNQIRHVTHTAAPPALGFSSSGRVVGVQDVLFTIGCLRFCWCCFPCCLFQMNMWFMCFSDFYCPYSCHVFPNVSMFLFNVFVAQSPPAAPKPGKN